jgi:hypothetical protein
MKRKEATWNPLDPVDRAVDRLLDAPAPQRSMGTRKTAPAAKSGGKPVGRPRVEGRRRIVLYLDASQAVNLKIRAVQENTDASAIVRRVLKEAGF